MSDVSTVWPRDRWYLLRAWYVLVQGYRDGEELQAVINQAVIANAPPNSLYFDYASCEYVTTETLARWRYEMFLQLLRKAQFPGDIIGGIYPTGQGR